MTQQTMPPPYPPDTRVTFGIGRTGRITATVISPAGIEYDVLPDGGKYPETRVKAHQVSAIPLDLDEVRAQLADNGVDGPDRPYNPQALAAMRAADAMLAELTWRRAYPIDMRALAQALEPQTYTEPADGTMILVNEEAAYVRSDQDAKPGDAAGDWFGLHEDVGTDGPLTLGEILDDGPRAVDDPPSNPNTYEMLFTKDDVLRIVAQVVENMQAHDEHTIREQARR